MRLIPVLFLLMFVASCTDKNSQPSGIIPREKMEKVLWDMIQVDQYADLYLSKDSARIDVKTETRKLYQQVFLLHKVSREEFQESFQYYLDRPDQSRNLFDSLLAKGNRMRTDYYSHPGSLHPGAQPAAPAQPAPVTPVAPQQKSFTPAQARRHTLPVFKKVAP